MEYVFDWIDFNFIDLEEIYEVAWFYVMQKHTRAAQDFRVWDFMVRFVLRGCKVVTRCIPNTYVTDIWWFFTSSIIQLEILETFQLFDFNWTTKNHVLNMQNLICGMTLQIWPNIVESN